MDAETREQIRETLTKQNNCYVLITCGDADDEGKLQVDFTYSGDPVLAAYLLEGAQNVIEEQIH